MNVNLSGRFCPDGDIDRLVLNDIADDGVAVQRYAAGAAIHVDAGRAGRRVVRDIGAVESDIVAGDQVPGEDRPGLVGVHRDSRLAIADQPVADDDILVGGCLHCRESGWARRGEYPDPDAVARHGQSVV